MVCTTTLPYKDRNVDEMLSQSERYRRTTTAITEYLAKYIKHYTRALLTVLDDFFLSVSNFFILFS